MTRSEHQPLPLDPGPVPAVLRDAYSATAAARRIALPGAHPSQQELDHLLDESLDDETRLSLLDQLLGSRQGIETLAYLVAARISTAAPAADADRGPGASAAVSLPFVAHHEQTPRWRIAAMLKPIMLAASLLTVAGSGWYVLTLPPRGDDVRAAGSEVQLRPVQPGAAARPVTLIWKPRRSVSRYRVEILDTNDDPVFTTETNDTTVVVPPGTLAPGTYRWWVRSRASDGTEIRSRVEKLTIR